MLEFHHLWARDGSRWPCPGFQKPKRRQSWAYDVNDNLQDPSHIPNLVFMVKHNFFLNEDSPNDRSFEAPQNLCLAPHTGGGMWGSRGSEIGATRGTTQSTAPPKATAQLRLAVQGHSPVWPELPTLQGGQKPRIFCDFLIIKNVDYTFEAEKTL